MQLQFIFHIHRGLEEEYFIAMTDLSEVRKAAAVGFVNVAAVGLMINMENLATDACHAVLLANKGQNKLPVKTSKSAGLKNSNHK